MGTHSCVYAICILNIMLEGKTWLRKKPAWLSCFDDLLLRWGWEKLHSTVIKTTCSSGRIFVLYGRMGNLLETCWLLGGKKNILIPGRGS